MSVLAIYSMRVLSESYIYVEIKIFITITVTVCKFTYSKRGNEKSRYGAPMDRVLLRDTSNYRAIISEFANCVTKSRYIMLYYLLFLIICLSTFRPFRRRLVDLIIFFWPRWGRRNGFIRKFAFRLILSTLITAH